VSHRSPVWITGVGTATPLGRTYMEFADQLLAGRSAVDRVSGFHVEDHPSQIAGQLGEILCPALVFSTKEREPWLDDAIRPAMFDCLAGILKEGGGTPFIINGVDDHVHILTKLRPDKSLSHVMSDLKSRSSGWVHRTYPGREFFSWQVGYGAFTVSQSRVEAIHTYIKNQEEHHRRKPFQDELRELLRKHGQDVDESLLWQ
jgi:putative transposase